MAARTFVMQFIEDGEPRESLLSEQQAEEIGLLTYGLDPGTFLEPDDDDDESDDD